MLLERSNGAALAGLFGPKQKRLRHDYPTLAAALADSDELKSLGEIMAGALGIEVPHDEADADSADDIEARPYERSTTSTRRFAPDAVTHVSPAVMQATVALLKSHGWSSRAWRQ